MYETYTTIMGKVVGDLRCRQTGHSGEVVSFRVACFSRRLDRDTGQWADGPALYLTVTCWRRLAVLVAETVRRGSSIIAHGQLRTNEFVGNDGIKRSDLEMMATSLGLDLAHHRPESPGPHGPDHDPAGQAPAPATDADTAVTVVASLPAEAPNPESDSAAAFA